MDPLPDAMAAAKARRRRPGRALYRELCRRLRHAAAGRRCCSGFAEAAQAARAAGLDVNAGHDLNRENLAAFLRAVPGVREVSIGHALISDALELGYAATVRAYLAAIDQASSGR